MVEFVSFLLVQYLCLTFEDGFLLNFVDIPFIPKTNVIKSTVAIVPLSIFVASGITDDLFFCSWCVVLQFPAKR